MHVPVDSKFQSDDPRQFLRAVRERTPCPRQFLSPLRQPSSRIRGNGSSDSRDVRIKASFTDSDSPKHFENFGYPCESQSAIIKSIRHDTNGTQQSLVRRHGDRIDRTAGPAGTLVQPAFQQSNQNCLNFNLRRSDDYRTAGDCLVFSRLFDATVA